MSLYSCTNIDCENFVQNAGSFSSIVQGSCKFCNNELENQYETQAVIMAKIEVDQRRKAIEERIGRKLSEEESLFKWESILFP
jgi:hypothetical protein